MLKNILKEIIYNTPFFGWYFKLKTVKFHSLTFMNFTKFYFFRSFYSVYWPKHDSSTVAAVKNIELGINSSIGGAGNYIQGNGKLIIGNYVIASFNVGMLSGNHDLNNHNKQVKKTTKIGDYSWIGMNSVILPGVELGKRTIVAAGSVVTKSFPEGFCVIGGNPAKKIKDLDPEKFVPHNNKYEFIGYYPASKFNKLK